MDRTPELTARRWQGARVARSSATGKVHGQHERVLLQYDAPVQTQDGEAAMNASTLWWGLLFGSIGLGFFVYGRKQRAIVPLVCGVALMLFPYVVSGTAWLLVTGAALIAIPYFVRI